VVADRLPLAASWSLPSRGLGGDPGLNASLLLLWSVIQAEAPALRWPLLVLPNWLFNVEQQAGMVC